MSLALGALADEVGVSERTLRRAVSGELIRARRPSSRRLLLSGQEEAWVRRHWPLVGQLLGALRTEPNLELAVLFGSAARGDDQDGSDLDLLVGLRRPSPGALEALRARLSRRLPIEAQLVPLEAAREHPRLLAEVLRDGRPLVDRERAWPRLRAGASQTQARADQLEGESREAARAALGYFQGLAVTRARSPVGASL
ncbi:MAG TPA: nucleotidyltransferase domain-containing protein [Solirubrobacteraceae bacterium]|jgi:predicted nucleotidyltransferase|nr:nucleotidyltransferase domain-containing protein [Solirubrobacteraceae bacterium]